MRAELKNQIDRIEAVLSLHKVPARVTGGTVTPRWVHFRVLPAVGTEISKIKGLSEELAAALDAPDCRVSRRGAAVAVEVPRDDPQPVRLLPLYERLTSGQPTDRPTIPPATVILGLAEDGAPLLVRLPSPKVGHILVAGAEGAGKTTLLQAIVLSLAMSNPPPSRRENKPGLALILMGSGLELLQDLPHLARPAILDKGEATETLVSLARLMEIWHTESICTPRVVAVIDELDNFISDASGEVLKHLTRRGREVGIHVIAATQKPTSAVLELLVNFPVRLVGQVTDASDARTASGWSDTGAERLLGRGDFVAVAEGKVIRFQGAYVSPEEIAAVTAPGQGAQGAVVLWRRAN